MHTYLVTGGAGFIGANFIKYIFRKHGRNISIVNLDKLTYAGNLASLADMEGEKGYHFIKGDICDRKLVKEVFASYDIDYVVNFAAESHVDRSITEPDVFIRTNIMGTQVLLDEARLAWETGYGYPVNRKFLQVSTDEVYGSLGSEGYFSENTPVNPHSPYSASKAGADMIVQAYYDTYGLPVNITRCSNNYGPYQFPEKLIPLLIRNCLRGISLPVYGDGRNVRDWLYVEDHCAAIDLVLRAGKAGQVYNIGGNNERQNIEIVNTVINMLNVLLEDSDRRKSKINASLIKYVEDRKGHDRRYAIDAGKIMDELGWKPAKGFDDGIKETVQWYLNNEAWLENVQREIFG